VDDRGVGKSTGAATLRDATMLDFADDTRAQVAWLRTRPEIDPDRIALVGHSEGGIIGPLVASTDPRIATIVLLAGPGKTGEQVLLEQIANSLDEDPGMTKEVKEAALKEKREMFRLI